MAKVQVQVAGGEIKEINEEEITTVGDIKEELGKEDYVATVNGEPVDDDHELSDYEFVTLAKPVKAGA